MFREAFRGMWLTFKTERNMKIHLVIAFTVFLVSYYLSVDLIPILFCIGLVFAFEEFNSSIERLCDLVQPDLSEEVRDVKDIAAGSVLISALMAVAIAVILVIELIS